MIVVKTFNHLAAALPIEDPAFDEYWENYLRAMPAFTAGAGIEVTREQLRTLFKLAFLAGREASLAELGGMPIADCQMPNAAEGRT